MDRLHPTAAHRQDNEESAAACPDQALQRARDTGAVPMVEGDPTAVAAAAADHHTDRSDTCSSYMTSTCGASSRPDPAEVQALRKRGKGERGCSHYRRRCKIVAPCCGEVFWCRHCHNQVMMDDERDHRKRHELNRREVKEVVCAMCDLRQAISDHCAGCGASFGAYHCLDCSFFDDELEKQQFHCNACGICRVGGRDKFFHCHNCGCCYAKSLKDNHVCIENSMRQNCPICFEFLFDSVRPTAVLSCGHTIHSECLNLLQRNHTTTCPICMKSYGDMKQVWERMDEEVAQTPMPAEYNNWQVDLLCNDCQHAGRSPFHILGQKCAGCGSYNTRRMAIDRAGGDPGPLAIEGAQPPAAAAAAAAVPAAAGQAMPAAADLHAANGIQVQAGAAAPADGIMPQPMQQAREGAMEVAQDGAQQPAADAAAAPPMAADDA